jgi:F-type H+-transporting ATPase subunit delta
VSSEFIGTKTLADRYATALYALAEERKALDQVADDLRGLDGMLVESSDFRRFIMSPVLSRDEQRKGIAAIAEKAALSQVTTNLLGLLASNRRLFALRGITSAFLSRLAAARGEMTAEVTSAKKLTEKQQSALSAALKQVVGKDVAIEAKVDPAVLGGLIVKVGSRMVDSSVRTKLLRLQLAMKGVG